PRGRRLPAIRPLVPPRGALQPRQRKRPARTAHARRSAVARALLVAAPRPRAGIAAPDGRRGRTRAGATQGTDVDRRRYRGAVRGDPHRLPRTARRRAAARRAAHAIGGDRRPGSADGVTVTRARRARARSRARSPRTTRSPPRPGRSTGARATTP